ncbi:acylneuraminate cytidylyltransferase family protein [Desulfovibrio legallii]|uniref:N-acylneuraminate cytidylyltransferase n=1 Tax=Desulfovibrio legallii TaxID=571438 RepID=A0A1G7J7J0_9BACT|nr:acylneuraminate cytidylyltransferase family protein [Desulfovibrio legallii]SDF20942.1 N-acylneuraminate cytidylyltransferase [Desulfovibrio legallii]
MARQPIVYAFIFARGGSKGVPRKNIRRLVDKPLIAYPIETAKQIAAVKRIIVSTDDMEIAAVARQWGAETPFMRPPELATDDSPEWEAWRHALRQVGCTEQGGPCDVFLSLPATAPLRSVDDVERCLAVFSNTGCDAVITTTPAARHPMFNMVSQTPDGMVHLAQTPSVGYCRRQDVPPLFDMTTAAYVLSPTFILRQNSLMAGHVRQVVLPRERAVDIDDALDLAFAEFLLAHQQVHN